ncbi:cache domain-containing sensor histidine kinase [Paenibacillus sedimenti]|uniref:histidine kinase n=1 Tax=Paenibacillus sedimenti TaxID=2770274 RepID=A0A926QGT3_9BACL|nr:sensor histidine kinase [Paenibacillus sedimenti]MBD0378776.1 sensor histidine kinase [Paenibacillus sedimenti]
MRAIRRLFVSLRTKFIILFCVMITLPFIISGLLAYQKYSANSERNAEAYSEQIVEQVTINLERYIKEMDRITIALYYNPDVLQILKNHRGPLQNESYLKVDEISKMNQLISTGIIEQTEMEGLFIFALDGSLFSNLQETIRLSWKPESNSWMQQAKWKDGGLTIVPPMEGSYYLEAPKEVLSLARLIKDPVTNQDLGYVKADLTNAGFQKIVSSVKVTKNSQLYVFNEDFKRVYPFSDSRGDSYQDIVNKSTRDVLVSSRATAYGVLQIVGLIPREDVLSEAKQMTTYTLWISLCSLLMAYVAAVFTSSRMVKPIGHLQKKMRRVQNGEFHERAEVYSNDEIGLLTEGFNTMVSQLESMIKDMYELRLREKESELNALQSQINPHFLYNTLESISMAAHKQSNTELSDVITSLGKLLRYTVNKQERLVYLKDELAFVESYLNIQTFRLEDKLDSELRVDFLHEYALVPKLILQPLVENAIEHGPGSRPLKVTIYTRAEDNDLFIYVQDNGVGIPAERMKLIETRLAQQHELTQESASGQRSKGFALRNIHQRLRLLYGESYGLSIQSSAGSEGTTIVLRLPFQWEE